jgi:hypothetical protein
MFACSLPVDVKIAFQFTLFVISIDCFLETEDVVGERMKHTLMLILTCISFKLVTSAYTPKTYYSNFMVCTSGWCRSSTCRSQHEIVPRVNCIFRLILLYRMQGC